tara:strand:+ start:1871 stop:2461 length:591 start_codon:yes stop_codon:yes gene_type:complete
MFLRKNKFNVVIVFIIIFIQNICNSNEIPLTKAVNYLKDLNNFSVSFIQSDDFEISEGKISFSKNRLRVDYSYPSKILIILSKNKAMYYNYELDEDEFFDPRNTSAWFFFEIFNNPDFFLDAKVRSKENSIILEKNGLNQSEEYKLKLYFENNPFLIRKIELNYQGTKMVLSVSNHNFEESFNKNFFKLINPSIFD